MLGTFFFILVLNIIFLIFFDKISKKINVFDIPINPLKNHKKKTSAIGGLLFLANIVCYFISNNFGIDNNYLSSKENLSIIIFIILFFFIGLYDDKFQIKANTKLLLSFIIIFIFLLINENFIINNLKFSFLNSYIDLKNIKIVFTMLCFILLINAFNMFDGMNLQFGFYILILSILLFSKSVIPNFFIIIIITCLFFLYLNYKSKLFIGNNGTLFFGALFSILFIYYYNFTQKVISADEIFLYLSIPGFDFLRVSFSRLYRNKNIFLGDKNHLHHLLIKKHTFVISTFLIQTIIVVPIIYVNLTNKFLYGCLISLGLYISLVFYCKNCPKINTKYF
jgi:UDP-GlcNAc:undecaprenyl-phosphate GlcNAc-1-phosphate transferase